MFFKLFERSGKYRDKDTLDEREMVYGNHAYSKDGDGVGWDTYNSVNEAMTAYNIELKPDLRSSKNVTISESEYNDLKAQVTILKSANTKLRDKIIKSGGKIGMEVNKIP